jgi:hypothetical protein
MPGQAAVLMQDRGAVLMPEPGAALISVIREGS